MKATSKIEFTCPACKHSFKSMRHGQDKPLPHDLTGALCLCPECAWVGIYESNYHIRYCTPEDLDKFSPDVRKSLFRNMAIIEHHRLARN